MNIYGFVFIQRNDSIGMSKRSYMEAVVEGLRGVTAAEVNFAPNSINVDGSMKTVNANGTTRKKIYVRLLLSIDRRETTEAAMETVCLGTMILG